MLVACVLAGCTALASKEALIGCQVADTATTLEGIDRGAKELNPMVDSLLAAVGPAGFVAIKAGVTLVVLQHYAEVSQALLAALNGATCAVAAHNAYVIRQLPTRPRSP